MKHHIFLFSFLLMIVSSFCTSVGAQDVIFNEVVSSNQSEFDEEGDTPDWFELYNTTLSPIDLNGWSITDNINKPKKWLIPTIQILPSEYLQIWASGKDRNTIGKPRTIISQGDTFRYIVPSSKVDTNWIRIDYDDSEWLSGETSIGYGDSNLATDVPNGTGSVYLRKIFDIIDINNIIGLSLHVDYNDAFVAYLNGQPLVKSTNIKVNPDFDDFSFIPHESNISENKNLESYFFENIAELIVEGQNIICFSVHNHSANSFDLVINPFLSVFYNIESEVGIKPPEILNINNNLFHTNFKISSKKETLYLFNDAGSFVDSILTENIPFDFSYGKKKDSNENVFFQTKTPGAQNSTEYFQGINSTKINFSHQGGICSPLLLSLSGDTTEEIIRYTLDATEPTTASEEYTTAIQIDTNTIVRAKIFKENQYSKFTYSRSYLINVSHELPVMSLITAPDNLFDTDIGIYAFGTTAETTFPYHGSNFWEDWERPIHITLYDQSELSPFVFDGGIKIFGAWSRGYAQKSFSFFARKKYGLSEMQYPLFPSVNYNTYQSFLLRNSGNEWLGSMLRDLTTTSFMEGSGIDYQVGRPVVTYINGQFWGFYNMREKTNEHLVASKHNLNADDIDLLFLRGSVINGSNEDYLSMIDFIENNTLESNENFKVISNQINIENFIKYYLTQIYIDNTDWPGNNKKFWRHKNGKWNWILYDTDIGLGGQLVEYYARNTLEFALDPIGSNWTNEPWSTLLFRRLMENDNFKRQFVNQYADEMNSRFLPHNMSMILDKNTDIIISEIENHYDRWDGNIEEWYVAIDGMHEFIKNRPYHAKEHIKERLSFPDYHNINIKQESLTSGFVLLNSLAIDQDNNWNGDYFENNIIKLTAIPRFGYMFSHWKGDVSSLDPVLLINMEREMTITPVFRKSDTTPSIVINEINYYSSDDFDSKDWIELHNTSSEPISLENWKIQDTKNTFHFIPKGTFIKPYEFLVFSKNKTIFSHYHPTVENIIGDFDFSFSKNGGTIKLYTPDANIHDQVSYDIVHPWPNQGNQSGATIELLNPTYDNSVGENWDILHQNGSPGTYNRDSIKIETPSDQDQVIISPNPSGGLLILQFPEDYYDVVSITLADINGSLRLDLLNEITKGTINTLLTDQSPLSPGIYIIHMTYNDGTNKAYKWVKI